jgi:hypothetical protein
MKSSLPPPTVAEARRIDEFRWIGCVVSYLHLKRREPNLAQYDVHHLVDGNRKLGWAETIPLHPWYHRGLVEIGWTAQEMREEFGPSKARNPREFSERFGSDLELLEATNALLDQQRKSRAA